MITEDAVIEKMLNPASFAVVGASARPGSLGNMLMKKVTGFDYKGKIYPINPKTPEIEGIKAYPSVMDVPGEIDTAVLCVPGRFVIDVVKQLGKKGVRSCIIISAGFKEIGPEGVQREKELKKIARDLNIRIIGPNCFGIINGKEKTSLDCTFARNFCNRGKIGFISQSGALGAAVNEDLRRTTMGLSYFISLGNRIDFNENEALEYLAQDPETKVIMVYLENFANPLKFLEIARKVTPEKPIIAIKAGRGEKAAKAVASHTGSLAQSDSMIDALMKKAGVVRVFSVDEMIMAAKAMYAEIIPRKQDLAIITNAGGFGVLSIDKAEELGIRLASLNEKTVKFLKENLPEEASCHNPVDLLGTATDKEYAVALEGVLRDPDVGGIVYNFGPPVMQKAAPIAQCAVDLARKYPGRLILSIYMNRRRVMWPFEEAKDVYIAQYDYPEDAVFGYSKLMEYARARRIVREQPAQLDVGREKVRKILDDAEREGKKQLDFDEAEEILKIYGIPVASSAIVRELDQLETQSGHIRFPVAVKPLWGGIVHKTEMNAVRIGIKDKVELALALREISKGIEEITGEKYTRGFVVQEMARGDREIIMGFSRQAGDVPTLIFGLGGIFVEALKDVSIAIPPITRNEAREMIQSIKSYPLLKGFRGKPGIDLESLAETLVRISHLANDFPRIREMDMNPFIASAKKGESLAVDVRMIL